MSGTGPGEGNGSAGGGSAAGGRLLCGRPVESLLEAATETGTILDAHQRSCPYCGAALRALRIRWAAVVAEAGAPVAVPAGLVDRMVDRIRAVITEPAYLEAPSVRGRLRIARSVVEDIARQVLRDRNLTVLAATARQDAHGLTITVHVVLPYGVAAAREAQRARVAVIRAVAASAGLDVAAVDVAVMDVDLGLADER